MKDTTMMAVCGLDCGTRDIRRAPTAPDAAQVVVAWFQEMGWLEEHESIAEVTERGIVCTGCRGDRYVHWSPDCPLLGCCVDEKHLEHCAQCDEFVCTNLEAFAHDGQAHHAEAIERLKRKAAAR
mgnify:CR=1 FL=1